MRPLLLGWAGLLVLLALTAGLAYLPLGAAAMPAALIIAMAMAMTIALFCMKLATAPRLAAIFAAGGICWFLVLLALGSVDYSTRTILPVAGTIHPEDFGGVLSQETVQASPSR
jgi:cytochrome c oxidase subunit IV